MRRGVPQWKPARKYRVLVTYFNDDSGASRSVALTWRDAPPSDRAVRRAVDAGLEPGERGLCGALTWHLI